MLYLAPDDLVPSDEIEDIERIFNPHKKHHHCWLIKRVEYFGNIGCSFASVLPIWLKLHFPIHYLLKKSWLTIYVVGCAKTQSTHPIVCETFFILSLKRRVIFSSLVTVVNVGSNFTYFKHAFLFEKIYSHPNWAVILLSCSCKIESWIHLHLEVSSLTGVISAATPMGCLINNISFDLWGLWTTSPYNKHFGYENKI